MVRADVGDVLAESNFRTVSWSINTEKGKDSGAIEQDIRQAE